MNRDTLDHLALAKVCGGSALKMIGIGSTAGMLIMAPVLAGDWPLKDWLGFASVGVGWGGLAGWAAHGIRRARRGL